MTCCPNTKNNYVQLCCKFDTKMERAVVLDRLRKSGTFPKNFEDPKFDAQRAVIRWLLKRKPDQRYILPLDELDLIRV